MTEDKKKKLEQVLKDAVTSLEIRSKNGTPSPDIIPITTYKQALMKSWNYHTTGSIHHIDGCDLHIMNDNTKLNLLEFISEHYEPFIHKDRIHAAMSMRSSVGHSIIFLLEQILRIYIVYGIEKVVSKMEDTKGSFKFISMLEGITINAEIHISENLKVIPRLKEDLKNPLPRFITESSSESKRMHELMNPLGKTLLVCTCSISSLFLKPIQDETPSHDSFGMKFNGEKYSYDNMKVICDKFANSLSLACNSPVQISKTWVPIEKDEISNFDNGHSSETNSVVAINHYIPKTSEIGQNEVSRAKTICENIGKLNSRDQDRVKISIDRWIKSKISTDPVDKLIELRIAFESIFLSDKDQKNELSYQFRLRGACLLGKTLSDRQELKKKFQKIYDQCSKSVHTGKIGNNTTNEFIEDAQNLCRDSIMKILDAGKPTKPNEWDDLILGTDIL